jgi:hypothetical protein
MPTATGRGSDASLPGRETSRSRWFGPTAATREHPFVVFGPALRLIHDALSGIVVDPMDPQVKVHKA